MAPTSTAVGTLCRRSKRARTAHPDCWGDWANLTAGPAGLIAEKVLADDVAGYIRFRAVCTSWRRCTEAPHAHGGLDSRFHPRRWIMLPEIFAASISRRDFLNISTGERIRVDLPALRLHFVIGPTSSGLILLCQSGTRQIHLLNPLTQQLTALPNATSLLNNSSRTVLSNLEKLRALGLGVGLADGSTVALHLDGHGVELAVAKPNDEQWSCRARSESDSSDGGNYSEPYSIIATLSFADRFYCVTKNGIKVVDATAAGQRPQLVPAVEEDEDFYWQRRDENLVDNDGELIMVRPNSRSIMERYQAYRVDLEAGKMVPTDDLRGRAVFVCDSGAGRGRSASVHAGLSSSIRADTVYRCSSRGDGLRVEACHLKKGWITRDLRVRPGSIVDYLSRFVCRSKDTAVPAPPLRRRTVKAAAGGPRKRKGKRKRKANSKVIGNEWVN